MPSLRSRLLLAAFVLLGLGGTAPAGAAWQPATQISATGEDADQPQVALDKKGNALAVWRRSDGANFRIEAAIFAR